MIKITGVNSFLVHKNSYNNFNRLIQNSDNSMPGPSRMGAQASQTLEFLSKKRERFNKSTILSTCEGFSKFRKEKKNA